MQAIHSRHLFHRRSRRVRLALVVTACALVAAMALTPAPASADDGHILAVSSFYKPGASGSLAARGGSGGGSAQEPEQWSGTVAVPDPAGLQIAPDIYEFDVLEAFDNDRMSVAIAWDAGLEVAYDLDLYVDRLDDGGQWVRVGSSTNGQALGDGTAVEIAQVNAPVLAPGHYRARVVNWASAPAEYTGEIVFESLRTRKSGKPARGRATADRADETGLSSLHVIYMVPADGLDEELDLDGTLDDAVASMNDWFLRETPGRQLRLDTWTFANTTALDITFVRGDKTQAEYEAHADGVFAAITEELEQRGWNDDPGLKRYLVYYGGPAESTNVCGTAYYNTLGTDYAQWSVVFLDAASGCGAREFGTPETGAGRSEAIAVQEMLHNEALARPQSPHHCWAFQGHLCTAAAGAVLSDLDPESFDVLFPFVTYTLDEKVLDIDHDDYYEHPAPWNDLAESPFFE